MSSTAFDLRDDYAGSLPAIGRAAGAGAGQHTRAVSTRLLEYWRVTLPLPLAARRRALDSVCVRARRDAAAASDVVSFALGDPDEEIVYRATLEYLACGNRAGSHVSASAQDAIEWIRRRLALNCAAVFAALASLDDSAVLELLLPLRFALDEREFMAAHRRLAVHPPGPTHDFLLAWSQLRGHPVGADGRSAPVTG